MEEDQGDQKHGTPVWEETNENNFVCGWDSEAGNEWHFGDEWKDVWCHGWDTMELEVPEEVALVSYKSASGSSISSSNPISSPQTEAATTLEPLTENHIASIRQTSEERRVVLPPTRNTCVDLALDDAAPADPAGSVELWLCDDCGQSFSRRCDLK